MLAAISDEDYRKWEQEAAERRARAEFGETVADAIRFARKASCIQIAVAETLHGAMQFLIIPRATIIRSLRHAKLDDRMPTRFDPVDRQLIVGACNLTVKD